jgi:hypothetical protein
MPMIDESTSSGLRDKICRPPGCADQWNYIGSMRVHFKKTPSLVEVPFSTSFWLLEGVEASAVMSGGL